MQIVGTKVSQATAATGEQIVRLVFQGEGGERIAVDMASGDRTDDTEQDVLERARVMLVQTATFGIGKRSSYDGASVPSAPVSETFVFEYREGDGSRHASAIMPGAAAARAEAMRSAIDLIDETTEYNKDLWLIRVYDESGALVCSIDADEAVAEHQRAQAAIDI